MVNTKFTIEKRDLFTVPKDYILCHCISADFALGAGIAKKFAELGVKEELFKQYPDYKWQNTGACLHTKATGWNEELSLVTKDRYFHKPTLTSLYQALCGYRDHLQNVGDKIAMPKIGCGLDRLKWNDVEKIIKDVFADTDVEILVCDWR